ncbi:sensor histidine kinase [Herbiconiux ginsengi]|uniref:histidine kinase n=1 Tax=Herbiconiux ginsengi TaxID=381665 RepID=A0A1H3K441_9MICO|nr:histidine kinase [Herbiconiux ginsengi]SDY46946.1 Signal transduction histidine kinase [Herbiconiux ginsengi]
MFRPLKPYQLGFDIGLAVLCVGLRVPLGSPGVALVVVIMGMGLALALRRASPALALGTAWVFAIVQMASSLQPDVANLAILPVLYSTARYGGRVVKWAGLASAGAGALAASLYLTLGVYFSALLGPVEPPTVPSLAVTFLAYLFAAVAALVLSWTLGLLAKTWSAARESRLLQTIAEHNVAVEQERNRIARDMHDVVAHSLAVVIAQADGARYAMASDPGAAESALSTISSTARSALADVRVLLGELRHDEPTAPQPTLGDLQQLYDQIGASGLPVEVVQSGTPGALPAGSQLAVYRIVQEALTNAMRHGEPGAGATVSLSWRPQALGLRVSSRMAAQPAGVAGQGHALPRVPGAGTGHGIAGMRERAALVGGTFDAEQVAGEFVVTATIPVLDVTARPA